MRNLFVFIALFFLLSFSSCKKEDPYMAIELTEEVFSDSHWNDFNRTGELLEEVISYLVEDVTFMYQLVQMTNERPTGDFEVLLKDFLYSKMPDGNTPLSLILNNHSEVIGEAALTKFLEQYPSTIIAVRGNVKSWAENKHIPPVKFVPSNFQEKTKSTQAQRMGDKIQLDVSKPFEDAVVVISRSERHDFSGNLIIPPVSLSSTMANKPPGEPMIKGKDVEGLPGLKINCEPEPSSCPPGPIVINSFTATPQGGGIFLTYNISGLSPSLCTWSRIIIKRTSPGGQIHTWLRYANDPEFFYDNTGVFNITYIYEIFAYVAYIIPAVLPETWVSCPQSNKLSATATYPAAGPVVDTYQGKNQTSTSIRYDWYQPNIQAEQFRIQRATPSGYTTLETLGGNETSYFYYPVPQSFQGTLVETKIQYKAGGAWQGDFLDRTYASFRNPGQPLMYYGIYMADVTAFEYDESPLFGAPEIRLTALQATAAGESKVLQNTFLPMEACTQQETIWVFIHGFGWLPVIVHVNTGYFYPANAPSGYQILNSWNADLHSSAITIKTTETDVHLPIITSETNIEKDSFSLKASLGFKIPFLQGGTAGVESTWSSSNTTTVNILYPTSDLPIGEYTVYYHENPITVKGIELLGYIPEIEKCTRLSRYLVK